MSNNSSIKPDQTVNDFLSELDRIGYEQSIPVYIPSMKKTVKFKQLTTAQQKELLKSSIDRADEGGHRSDITKCHLCR